MGSSCPNHQINGWKEITWPLISAIDSLRVELLASCRRHWLENCFCLLQFWRVEHGYYNAVSRLNKYAFNRADFREPLLFFTPGIENLGDPQRSWRAGSRIGWSLITLLNLPVFSFALMELLEILKLIAKACIADALSLEEKIHRGIIGQRRTVFDLLRRRTLPK